MRIMSDSSITRQEVEDIIKNETFKLRLKINSLNYFIAAEALALLALSILTFYKW